MAQLDRAPVYGTGGWRFESSWLRHPRRAHRPLSPTSILVALSAAALAVAAFGLDASAAQACSCVVPPPPAEAREAAASVFEGRVQTVAADEEGVLQVSLEVVRTWKGADAERVEVRTRSGEAACGYTLEPGHSYLIYTETREGDEGGEWVSLCSRTRPIEEADEDVAAFGEGITPANPHGPEWEQLGSEPEQEPAEPPARGGCASCSAGAGGPGGLGAALALLLIATGLWRGRRDPR